MEARSLSQHLEENWGSYALDSAVSILQGGLEAEFDIYKLTGIAHLAVDSSTLQCTVPKCKRWAPS